MDIRTTLIVVFLYATQGCTKIEFDEPVRQQSYKDELFCEKVKGSGSHRIYIKDKSKVYLRAELDWNIDDTNTYQMDIVSPIGQAVFSLSFAKSEIKVQGAKLNKFHIKIDKSGFILLDNHKIGLKLEEIPCLLKGYFPKKWAFLKGGVIKGEAKDFIYLQDDGRKLKIKYSKTKKNNCAYISWKSFWIFLEKTLKICHKSHEQKTNTYLNIDNKFFVKLEALE